MAAAPTDARSVIVALIGGAISPLSGPARTRLRPAAIVAPVVRLYRGTIGCFPLMHSTCTRYLSRQMTHRSSRRALRDAQANVPYLQCPCSPADPPVRFPATWSRTLCMRACLRPGRGVLPSSEERHASRHLLRSASTQAALEAYAHVAFKHLHVINPMQRLCPRMWHCLRVHGQTSSLHSLTICGDKLCLPR